MTKRYYIAYGSNLNIDQMSYRCPGAKVVGTSEIPDFPRRKGCGHIGNTGF